MKKVCLILLLFTFSSFSDEKLDQFKKLQEKFYNTENFEQNLKEDLQKLREVDRKLVAAVFEGKVKEVKKLANNQEKEKANFNITLLNKSLLFFAITHDKNIKVVEALLEGNIDLPILEKAFTLSKIWYTKKTNNILKIEGLLDDQIKQYEDPCAKPFKKQKLLPLFKSFLFK